MIKRDWGLYLTIFPPAIFFVTNCLSQIVSTPVALQMCVYVIYDCGSIWDKKQTAEEKTLFSLLTSTSVLKTLAFQGYFSLFKSPRRVQMFFCVCMCISCDTPVLQA